MNNQDNIRTVQQLVDHINHGNKVKYVYFWGHRKPKAGISKTCFSQWYASSFIIDGCRYKTAEHYMMAEKARLFNDKETLKKILVAHTPGEAKQLGRAVSGFNESTWIKNRFNIVVQANIAKFEQNKELQDFLLNTGSRVLVEASPVDKIWGVGLAEHDEAISDPRVWKGLNLLGFALMEARYRLK